MQHLVIDAAPDPTFAHDEQVGGAFVACWIKDQTRKNALFVAKGWIEENGWVVLAVDQQQSVSADDFPEGAQGKEYFEQALIDEEVFVFHSFPKHDQT
jgi:hypothetical protein